MDHSSTGACESDSDSDSKGVQPDASLVPVSSAANTAAGDNISDAGNAAAVELSPKPKDMSKDGSGGVAIATTQRSLKEMKNQNQNRPSMSLSDRLKKLWASSTGGGDKRAEIFDGKGGVKRVGRLSEKRKGSSGEGKRGGGGSDVGGDDRETAVELERLLGEVSSYEGKLEGLLDMQNMVDVQRVAVDPEATAECGEE